MKCPSCGAAAPDGAAECPACGLIFAKWRERDEKEKREALAALEGRLTAPKLAPANLWVGRGIAGAVVLAWLLALSYYIVRHERPKKAPIGEDTGTFVQVRDPRTGEMRRLPVRRLGVPSAQGDAGQ